MALFAHFEAVFLAILGLFLLGTLLARRAFRLILAGVSVLVGALGLVAITGFVPVDGYFGRAIVSGPFSPIGWFFLSTGMVLFVLSWAKDD